MTCLFCSSWNQADPNCGHALYNGILLPARYATRRYTERMEVGSRAGNYLDGENAKHGDRAEFIERQVRYAQAGDRP